MKKERKQNIFIIVAGLCLAFCLIFFLILIFGNGKLSANDSHYKRSSNNVNDDIPPLDDDVSATVKPNDKKNSNDKKDNENESKFNEDSSNSSNSSNSSKSSSSSSSSKSSSDSNNSSNKNDLKADSDSHNKASDEFTKRY